MELPNVHYGPVSDKPLDWRKMGDRFDDVDDDEVMMRTHGSVIEMLGFDPLDMEDGDEVPAEIVEPDEEPARAEDAPADISEWLRAMVALKAQFREDKLKPQRADFERLRSEAKIPAYQEAPNTGREVALFGMPLAELHHQAEFEDWARSKGIKIPPFPHKGRAYDEDRPTAFVTTMHGLDLAIEYPVGSEHKGRGWSIILPYNYGYIVGHPGADGDSLDVAVNPVDGQDGGWAYLFDQRHLKPGKGFDETKVFIGYPNADAAVKAFRKGHDRWQEVLIDWTPLPISEFKRWLVERDPKKPAGDMVE